MNILIKLTCLVGLVIAPILGGHGSEDSSENTNTFEVMVEKMASNNEVSKKIVKMNVIKNDNKTVKAVVTTSTTINGETVTKDEIFEGTEEEVQKKLKAFEKGMENVKVEFKSEVKNQK